MLVFNLGMTELVYRGRTIPPNGGALDYADLSFIPDRDRANRLLSFGSLPKGWKRAEPKVIEAPATVAPVVAAPAVASAVEAAPVEAPPEVKAEEAQPKEGWKKKKY